MLAILKQAGLDMDDEIEKILGNEDDDAATDDEIAKIIGEKIARLKASEAR